MNATPLSFDMSRVVVQLLDFPDEELSGVCGSAQFERRPVWWDAWCRWSEMGAVPAGVVDVMLLPPSGDAATVRGAFERLRAISEPFTGGIVPSVYVGPPLELEEAYRPYESPLARLGEGLVFGDPDTVESARFACDSSGLLVGQWTVLEGAAAVELGQWRRVLTGAERLVLEEADPGLSGSGR